MEDEVHFTLTPADAAAIAVALAPGPAWGSRNWGRHERWRRVLAGMALAGLAFVVVKQYVWREAGLDLPPWEHGLPVLLAGGWVGWMLRPRPAAIPADDPRLGRRIFRWHSDGFEVDGDGFRNVVWWRAVTDIREKDGWLFVHTVWGDIHPVPVAALETPDRPDGVNRVHRCWSEGRHLRA
jgi:hypothetical protein